MTSLEESNDIQIEERRPGIWGAAFQVGLPHPVDGVASRTRKIGDIRRVAGVTNRNLVVGIGLALLVAGVLLYAWRRGWPESRGQIDTVW